jgi:hypothetical protein
MVLIACIVKMKEVMGSRGEVEEDGVNLGEGALCSTGPLLPLPQRRRPEVRELGRQSYACLESRDKLARKQRRDCTPTHCCRTSSMLTKTISMAGILRKITARNE